jgi:hypothetical protein
MPFVKLDVGILRSSLWPDLEARTVFLTALVMAEPFELREETPQLDVATAKPLPWSVPAGRYGFAAVAPTTLIAQAGIAADAGMRALTRLGEPEAASRSRAYDGRRLVRVEGGFLVLNFQTYREKDHSAASRQRKYRERRARTDGQRRAPASREGRDVTP